MRTQMARRSQSAFTSQVSFSTAVSWTNLVIGLVGPCLSNQPHSSSDAPVKLWGREGRPRPFPAYRASLPSPSGVWKLSALRGRSYRAGSALVSLSAGHATPASTHLLLGHSTPMLLLLLKNNLHSITQWLPVPGR